MAFAPMEAEVALTGCAAIPSGYPGSLSLLSDSMSHDTGEITTLHVTGLPVDFTERELYLLYVTMPGFEQGHMKFDPSMTRPPVAFVTFDTVANAKIAMGATNGLPYEGGNPNAVLRVTFASAPSRSNRKDRVVTSSGKPEGMQTAAHLAMQPQPHIMTQPQPQIQQRFSPYPTGGRMAGGTQRMENSPCSTLYVTSSTMGMPLDDDQLRSVFSQFPGLVRVSSRNGQGWVKFQTIEQAAVALTLDGHCSPLTANNPIRVSYARTDSK